MNDSARVAGRLRRAWPPIARTAAAIITMAALALLAACGGRPSAASSGSPAAGGQARSPSTNSQKALAFSACVRVHGVPNYPDADGKGQIVKATAQQLGVSNSQLQAALDACQHLLPNTGNVDDNPAALNQWWSQMQHFAQCMHAHGVPNWPGPTAYPQDPVRPTFNLHAAGIGFHQGSEPGFIVNSPQIEAEVRQCESVLHQNFSGYFD
ncbi:MAG: hypothetical protein ACR2FU_13030 [Streptosporangiaceae bacterium]